MEEGWKEKSSLLYGPERKVAFTFAGLYDSGYGTFNVANPTHTIITTNANEFVAPLHNRMPVILKQKDENRWLTGDASPSGVMKTILRPYPQ
jgi:putative SOS response-associated peptidase YedK